MLKKGGNPSTDALQLRSEVLGEMNSAAPAMPSAEAAAAAAASTAQAAGAATAKAVSATMNPELANRYIELQQIGQKLREDGYTHVSDAETKAAIERGDYEDVRFVVSLQKKKDHSETVAYRRPDTGRAPMWNAPYDSMKAGDLSAPLLCAMIGTEYELNAEYELYVIDKGEDYKTNGPVSFVPTWAKLGEFGPKELAPDAPSDPVHDAAVLREAVKPGPTQQMYREGHAKLKASGGNEYKSDEVAAFAVKEYPPEQAQVFLARHIYRTQIGVNPYFTGEGYTEFVHKPESLAAIEQDGIKLNEPPGKVGVPEVLTLEKNPASINDMKASNKLLAITL